MKKISIFFVGFSLTVSLGVLALSFFSARQPSPPLLSATLPEESLAEELGTPLPSPYIVYEPLTRSSIFSAQRRHTVEADDVVIVATGDIIPARVTNAKMKAKGVDYPFLKVDELLKSGDFTVANLEAPLLENCQVTLEGMSFCGTAEFAPAMKNHGISLATLENNHIGNHGLAGIEETKKILEKADLPYARFDTPYVTTLKDIRFGFLPVNGVGPSINKELLATRIRQLKETVDVVIVCVHWGKEYTYDPLPAPGIAPDDPREIAHTMVDSGADVVFGNHPHWVQGVEFYKEGFIAYGHGNFIFDQEWSQETKEGVVGSYVFSRGKLVDVVFTPIVIEDFAQPRLATPPEADAILGHMQASTERLAQ